MTAHIAFKDKLNHYNIKINIIHGIMTIIAFNLVNPYFAKFIERIGGTDYHIASLSSLPAFVSIFALIPGAILIEGFRNKKQITSRIIFSHKIFYLLLALVPLLPRAYQPSIFVILVGLMNFPGSIALMGYQSSIGDLFNERLRGRAMGLRNRYSDVFRLLTTFIAGQLLKAIPSTNQEAVALYQVFFFVAFLLGIGEVYSFSKFRGIRRKRVHNKSRYIDNFFNTIKTLKQQRKFLSFMGYSLLFHFGWQMGWPLFSIYSINVLHADEGWLSAIAIAGGLSSILTVTLWARLADRKGNGFALGLSTLGMAITPFLYASAHTLLALVFYNVIIGVSVAGTILILFNILLDVSPKENRTIYIGIYNTLLAISATITPYIGVWFKTHYSIYIALIIVGCLRFIGSLGFFIRERQLQRKKRKHH